MVHGNVRPTLQRSQAPFDTEMPSMVSNVGKPWSQLGPKSDPTRANFGPLGGPRFGAKTGSKRHQKSCNFVFAIWSFLDNF